MINVWSNHLWDKTLTCLFFHEDCMNIIMNDLIELMDPRYIEVWGKFTPRGGISIDPYTNYGKPGTKYEKMAEYRHDLYPETIDNR
ncbi:NADPH-dependent 7-cyano-7-deazaguanine reductase [Bacillus subtilis]|nr:NADPH-dependent 7-cyano-7-deazaguanine reductase [Bacillus subtilis]